jgi:hypothetical protein
VHAVAKVELREQAQIFCAATAAVALRTGALPRWVAAGAGITAVALAVNAAFLEASFLPALLLFIVWNLVASVSLLSRARRAVSRAGSVEIAV